MWPFKRKEKKEKISYVTIEYMTYKGMFVPSSVTVYDTDAFPDGIDKDVYYNLNEHIQKYLFDVEAGNFHGYEDIERYIKLNERKRKLEKIKSRLK